MLFPYDWEDLGEVGVCEEIQTLGFLTYKFMHARPLLPRVSGYS